jgi:hypothetical protein
MLVPAMGRCQKQDLHGIAEIFILQQNRISRTGIQPAAHFEHGHSGGLNLILQQDSGDVQQRQAISQDVIFEHGRPGGLVNIGIFFVLGGLAGAAIFMMMYEPLSSTWLYQSLLGGKVTLAQTGKYTSIIDSINGAVVAIAVGAVLILIAFKLPDRIKK